MVVMVLLVFLMVVLPLPLVPVLVIFGYRKKKRNSHDSRVLLPLNLHGFIHKAPRKITMRNVKFFCYCHR